MICAPKLDVSLVDLFFMISLTYKPVANVEKAVSWA